ncbi:hypothetical protein EX895_001972 [Sporisorium graminicola]|uniref:Uncharacterized protein n=1 Tax=Sporisorium graminicola TaxID=280036 RepID=A0A4U7KXE0_9BASI|nr:hypothetical protein EX895_001972 [Sporisorium graminicola]TKY89441.1 hypothetical protein EX895_001972 [Sporisorium graminicola]
MMLVHSPRALFVALVALCLVHHVQAVQMPAMRRSLSSTTATNNNKVDDTAAAAAGESSAQNLVRRWWWGWPSSLGRLEDNQILYIPPELIQTHTPAEVAAWTKYLERVHRVHPDWKRVSWTPNGPVGFKPSGAEEGKH